MAKGKRNANRQPKPGHGYDPTKGAPGTQSPLFEQPDENLLPR